MHAPTLTWKTAQAYLMSFRDIEGSTVRENILAWTQIWFDILEIWDIRGKMRVLH